MKIREILSETGLSSKILRDDLGGEIIISPDPDKYPIDENFSIKYINHNMARTFGVNPRILGYDCKDHSGRFAPHLHSLQKSKNKGYLNSPSNLNFDDAYSLFTDLLNAIKNEYRKRENS